MSCPRHIAVEGAIGAGKTTLARLLAARLQAELLLERPQDNPFLGRFYENMPSYAFQTQLAFLVQRAEQWEAAARPERVVSDFMFDKDGIFARLNLRGEEFALYSRLRARLAPRIAPPDLVIWLQASPDVLLDRVHRRAIPMEQGMEVDYLQRLGQGYVDFFRGYRGSPVLAIDAEGFDPSAEGVEALLRRVDAVDFG